MLIGPAGVPSDGNRVTVLVEAGRAGRPFMPASPSSCSVARSVAINSPLTFPGPRAMRSRAFTAPPSVPPLLTYEVRVPSLEPAPPRPPV